MSILNKINFLKHRRFFQEDKNWDERGLNPSPLEIKQEMEIELSEFLNLVLELFKAGLSDEDILEKLQIYFNEWDTYKFDTEEAEFLYDTYLNVLKELEIDSSNIKI